MKLEPRLSIGLNVFNGENYINEAIESILAQTFTNFELIISDNASTDRTKEICLSYVKKDHRVHYYRNKKNLGASRNSNIVFNLTSGEYFKWASHDDVHAPDFLAKCVYVLDHNPSIVLCYTKTKYIDKQGKMIGKYDYELNVNSCKPHVRFGNLICSKYPLHAIFGVIRSNILRKTPLMGNYIGSDKNLLAELGLIGRLYEIPEYLFFLRKHPETYTYKHVAFRHGNSNQSIKTLIDWWDPSKNRKIIFPYNFIEYFRSIIRVPMKRIIRLLCYAVIFKWFFLEGWISLGNDIDVTFFRHSSLGVKLSTSTKIVVRKLMRARARAKFI